METLKEVNTITTNHPFLSIITVTLAMVTLLLFFQSCKKLDLGTPYNPENIDLHFYVKSPKSAQYVVTIWVTPCDKYGSNKGEERKEYVASPSSEWNLGMRKFTVDKVNRYVTIQIQVVSYKYDLQGMEITASNRKNPLLVYNKGCETDVIEYGPSLFQLYDTDQKTVQ